MDTGDERFDVKRLACYLSAPSLALRLHPDPPSAGPAVGDGTDTTGIGGSADADTFEQLFRATVAHGVTGHERAALLYTGDLGLAALLAVASAACRERGVPLLVLIADGVDADGVSLASQVQPSLAGLARGDTALIVEPHRWFRPEPADRTAAPDVRFPGFAGRARVLAADWGATVTLSPAGADDVLSAPGFMAGQLRRGHAARYLRDGWQAAGPAGPMAEVLSRLGPLDRSPSTAALRLSASRLSAATRRPPTVLSAEAQAAAQDWTRAWVRQATAAFRAGPPAQAEAGLLRHAALSERRTAVASRDAHGTGPATVLPYLDPALVAASAALPLRHRYDGRLPTPYQRRRAMLVRPVPRPLRDSLPQQAPPVDLRRSYAPDPLPRVFPQCAERGLLTAAQVPGDMSAPVLQRLWAVETWLTAVARTPARQVHPGGSPAR